MNYSDYIWDLGGTLLDNYQVSTQAFVATLAQFGKTAEQSVVYDKLKESTDTAVAYFATDIPDFINAYRQEEAQHLAQPVLFAGAAEVLAQIVADGGRNFLVSHRGKQVRSILKAAHIDGYFTEVVTAANGFARKPSPDSINYLIKKYKITNGLVIGDRLIDSEAGQAAGLDTLMVDGSKKLTEIVK
ncbi:HAD-IA family hydrolase [Streptococcus dentiloxodontae]